jgi:drug/metabolite transporter (DMT)-like permease
LVLGLLGVAVLVFDPNAFDGKAWLGYLLLAVSAWTWAANGVAQARHPSGLDPLQSSAWQMLVAGVLVGPIAAFVGGSQLRSIPVEVWLAVAVLTVTASIVAFVSFIYMVHRLPVYVVGSYTYVNTIVAALTSVLWLGERLSPRFWVAAMLVLLGVVLIQRPSQST